ncbi:MAG: HEAT repeat domain-containing protein [Planctomycetota bacterium]|nr:MAG: HEAT repeat domain-containing protein [Planctomycetota bacterium]
MNMKTRKTIYTLIISCSLAVLIFLMVNQRLESPKTKREPAVSKPAPKKPDADEPETPPEILELMQAFGPDAKGEGAPLHLLSNYRGPDMIRFLIKLLDHPDLEIKSEAARILGVLRPPSAAAPLVALLLDDEEDVRLPAAASLSRLPSKAVLPELRSVLDGFDNNFEAAQLAARLFGRLKDRDSVEALIKWLESPDKYLRREAVASLSGIGLTEIPQKLIALLDSESEETRITVASAIGHLHLPKSYELMLKLGGSSTAAVRREVATILGDYSEPGVVDALFKLTHDPDSSVREKALWSLIKQHDKSIALKLVPLIVDKDEQIANVASWTIGGIGNIEVIPLLRPLAGHKDVNVRIRVADILGSLSANECLPLLLQLLNDNNVEVNAKALGAIGIIGNKSVIESVYPFIRDDDAYVRRQAVAALGRMRLKESAHKIVPLLKDPDTEVQAEAMKTFQLIHNPETAPKLVEMLRKPSSRAIASWLLPILANERTVLMLVPLVQSEDADLRRAAVNVISLTATKEDAEAIAPLFKSDDSEVRKIGAELAGRLGADRYIEEIAALLKEEKESIRITAIEALGKFGPDAARKYIRTALNDPSAYVRLFVIDAVERTKDRSFLKEILAAAGDEDTDIKRAVASALGVLGGKEAFDTLVKLSRNLESDVRHKAAQAFAEVGDDRAPDELRRLCKDESSLVRQAAVTGLRKLELVDSTFVELLADEDIGVWDEAVKALIETKNPAYATAALKHFDNPDSGAIDVTVSLIREIGNDSVVPHLLKRLREGSAEVRAAAAHALGKFPKREVGKELIRAIKDIHMSVFRTARDSLVEIKASGVVDEVIELSRSDDPGLREAAARILGAAGGKKAGDALISMLSDGDKTVMLQAIDALGVMAYKKARPYLFKELEANLKSELELTQIVWSIGAIGQHEDAQKIIPFLKHESVDVRITAVEALGDIGAPGTAKHLIPLFNDLTVFISLPPVLVKLGDRSVIPQIEAFANARHRWIRGCAIKVLGDMRSESSVKKILHLLDDPEPTVRYSVIEVMGSVGARENIPYIMNEIWDVSTISA